MRVITIVVIRPKGQITVVNSKNNKGTEIGTTWNQIMTVKMPVKDVTSVGVQLIMFTVVEIIEIVGTLGILWLQITMDLILTTMKNMTLTMNEIKVMTITMMMTTITIAITAGIIETDTTSLGDAIVVVV